MRFFDIEGTLNYSWEGEERKDEYSGYGDQDRKQSMQEQNHDGSYG